MTTEFDLIDRIAGLFSSPEGVAVGIGDDCAVLDPGRFDLVTMDTLVEGVHFRRDWSTAEDVGWKAMAANLSDIAAMGGGPGAFFLSLALPGPPDVAWVDGLLKGMREAAESLVPESFEVSAGGGDITETSGPLVVTLTLLGEASPAGPVLRRGAVPGDRIVVLGATGHAEAGLAVLSAGDAVNRGEFSAMLEAYRRPRPNVRAGGLLGLYGLPSSMIDVSDGLIQDLGHLLKASQVGARVESFHLPIHPEMARLEELNQGSALSWALTGGEDYRLLLTVPPARMPKLWDMAHQYSWEVIDLGEVRSPDEGLQVFGLDGEPLEMESQGYTHFEAS